MIQESIEKLASIVNMAPALLTAISEEEMSRKASPGKWSKKEILGHLIDSATNNHQRFVRAQFEHQPEIRYDQNKWNECSFHQEIDSRQLISFWALYNQQLMEIIQRISPEYLTRQVKIGDELFSLEFLIVDYVAHLEHHLQQLIDYKPTQAQ